MSKPSRTIKNMIRIAEQHAALQAERDAAVKALAAAEAKLAAVREALSKHPIADCNADEILFEVRKCLSLITPKQ